MRVSIIIPTYNRAGFLVEAIESALSQDYKDIEVIISDNASTDYTAEVGKYYSKMDARVKYFRNTENIGMVRNWHKATFEYATGDWFLLLSDDDILINPEFISKAMELIQTSKNIAIVYSNSYVFDEALKTLTKLNLPFHKTESGTVIFSKRGTVRPQDFALCNVLFDRKRSSESDAFLNSNNLSCDTELFLRLCLKGNVGVVEGFASIYRVHSGNLLKSASKNLDLVVGSLDSLLKPLLEAERMQIDPEIIKTFIINSRIKREIIVALLKISAASQGNAKSVYRNLKMMISKNHEQILPSDFLFGMISVSSKAVTPLFGLRRKILYIFNAAKRMLFGRLVDFELLKQKVYIIE